MYSNNNKGKNQEVNSQGENISRVKGEEKKLSSTYVYV